MGFSRGCLGSFLVATMVFFVAQGDPLVPALCIFGDSVVDAGNNNNLYTLVKANFPPYGRDFVTHRPTGRFCNGKLATDFTGNTFLTLTSVPLPLLLLLHSVSRKLLFFLTKISSYTAEYLGFTSYPPAYLSQDAKGRDLLIGANFASAASGYDDRTADLYRAISLTQQVSNYKEWQNKVVGMVGKARANAIFAGAIHLLSAGSSDFVQNYYINPLLNRPYSPDQFSDILMRSYSTFVQNMYRSGARKIGVTNLPPTGCLPAAITLFGSNSNKCVSRLNRDAVSFNSKLNSTSQDLVNKFPGLKLVVFDIYQPLLDLIINPTDNGFFESRKACCGTGTIETSLLCNARSIGTCSNATQYVFWDGFHPSEACNEKLAQALLAQGFDLIS
ncbi:hypothetical protein RJ640_024117 [Escallonia rubra]|uniref:GDSL esterase/lipase n=1 Tax=Escallonia rubra TaxID=112253 RepID=A0AA88QM44_9ASTE|nr:hypothetical protein RJ640_024117 [Escallonia rubra]